MKPLHTRLVGLMVVSFAAVVYAADRTWDGGSAIDANWSSVTNWDGNLTAPAAGDALFFAGTTRLVNTNDLTVTPDMSVAGLTFNSGAGAFALWGNRITLSGNVTNWSSNAQTINLPMILSGTRAFSASNSALTVSGTLSGAGGLTKFGPQSLTLTASNFYDGVTSVSNGTLAVTHGSALGSTNGNTVVNCGSSGYLQLSGGITVAEPITLIGERSNGGSILSNSGSNTLTGAITTMGQVRTVVNGGATLVVRGGVLNGSGTGNWLILNTSGTLAFYDTPLNLGNNIFFSNPAGAFVLGVAGNTWAETWLLSGMLRLDITNALPASAPLKVGTSLQAYGSLDLNGNNQTVSQLVGPPLTVAATGYLTSTKPATLTVDQSVDTTYQRPLNGLLSLLKIGTGTLTLSNNLSTTTGNITVTNGTLVVAPVSSLGNSPTVTATGANATLELRTATAIADSASLSIANGAKLKIGTGLTETVGSLFLDGVQKLHGTWGPTGSGAKYTDDVHFTGGGKILVLSDPPVTAVNATWDAGGADAFLSTTNNWAGDVLPAFDGTTYALFGTGGSSATVDRAVSLYGMTFNRDGNFTVAAGAGIVTNGAGGITAAVPNTTSRAYALAEDVTLIAHQVWNVATNGAGVATLTVSGSVSAEDALPFTLTKVGDGTLVLSGSNTYDGVTTVSNGVLEISNAKALGSTNGNTVVNCPSGGFLQLSGGITVAEPITLNAERPGSNGSILNNVGSNTLTGAITTLGQVRTRVNGGTTLAVRGGIRKGDGGTSWLVLNAVGTLAFYDTPLNLSSNTFFCNPGGLIVLGVAGNNWAETQVASGTLRLDITNALPVNAPLKVGVSISPNGTLDLNGNSQTVCQLVGPLTVGAGSILTSTKPATLTVDQSVNTTYDRPLNGFLSLLKIGTGTLTLSNNLSTTTGNIAVTNGTLVVAPASNLGNCTNVTVTAPGTLTIQTSTGILDSASLFVANGGSAKVSLAAGVNETVSWLYFGNKMQRSGTYSATSGGGVRMVDTEHFAGTGILTVLHDKSGTLLRLQ